MGVMWEVLGAETVTVDGRAVALNQRPRAVLLCLLNEPNRGVSWERVAAFLWADAPPKTQRNSVARFVADLRRALGPHGDRIITQGGGYQVVVGDGELDTDAAQRALAEAKRLAEVDVHAAHAHAEIAMGLVGTEPNPWIVDLPDSQPVLLRNAEKQIEVLGTLAELKLRTGRHGELISVLEHGVEVHPYHERLWAHLAVALHRSGRTADALRALQRLRTELAEIGLEPSEVIHRLESRIMAGAAPDVAVHQRPIPGAPTGRSADLAAIEAALAAYRLVTIVGVVGSGKSLLASVVADDEELAGIAVHRIDLRSLRDATRVVPTIAAAVGVPSSQSVTSAEDLAAQLLPVSCLIVLDNCEHLRLECAGLAEAVTAAAQGVRVLATCREPLRADGEHVYRLDMLATREGADPTATSPAAVMLVESAGRSLPKDAPDLDAIESICEAVRGHPLAIELSAGLLGAMTPAELRDRLSEASGKPTPSPLALVLDVAWESLEPPEQALLARLSVFAGGCTLAAAEHVSSGSGSVAEGLAALSSRGLVSRTVEDRYVLDAPVREFAASRLSDRRETTVARDRLIDWLRELTATWGIAELGSIAEPGGVLIPEQANLIEALSHLRDEHRTEELAWFAIRSHGLWINHGMYTEIVRWLTPVVDDTSLSRAVRSAAATICLEADLTVGNFAMMAPWGEKAIELADGEAHDWIPMVSGFLALLSLMVPMSLSTEDLLDMAESAADRSDSQNVNKAAALMRRAQVAHHRRRYDTAVDYFREALALVEAEGRLLLALEMGESISLYLAGRREEALETVCSWKSRVETDEWHYQVDIVRAIIVGGCGEPEQATAELAAALRRHKPIAVWARADEFQTAFGLLADMRGDPRLSAELLATPLSGSPFLSSIVIEHVVAARGLDADGFREVALELRSRTFPETADRGAASTELELVSWWETGARRAEVASHAAP